MHPAKILVATDLSARGDAAVTAAFDLGALTRGEVHLLHVFARTRPNDDPTRVDDAERMTEHRLRNLAQERVSSVRRGAVILRRGDPAALIVHTARELGADLLVVGTHDRRGLARLHLGSVSEKVVHTAPCSVLVVRGSGPRT